MNMRKCMGVERGGCGQKMAAAAPHYVPSAN